MKIYVFPYFPIPFPVHVTCISGIVDFLVWSSIVLFFLF